MSQPVIRGSCLCNAVTYEIASEPINNVLCFCNNCRKTTGSIGMANSFFKTEAFKFTKGAENVRTYPDSNTDSGGTVERSFCGSCGSPLIEENKENLAGIVIVTSGTMDMDPSRDWAPEVELYCERKAGWLQTPGSTQKFNAMDQKI